MTTEQKFNCVFCKDSFDNKQDLQVHFRKHGDPKFNQSNKYNKVELDSHMEKPGTEVVSCDVCSEVFPTISKAITHKHKVHPDHDAKYFCPWCGKLFTMKHLYNKHVQSTHDGQDGAQMGFQCDCCEVDFFVPSAMLYHNKFFHRQDTELADIGHSKKLKICNLESLQLYYCPFCGEEYWNKVNLHKHMGDDHIDENQCPIDILRCPLCDAVFYHLDAYELHLTFHSNDDIYGDEKKLDITEFSLETVAPIMEKVENEYPDGDTGEAIKIEEFLQQVMDENEQGNSNDGSVREKRKKHKKHKKSKKAAITLDEFLTMNKDVFGEGIDVQGVEEIPTQIVAKQLKRKTPQKPSTKPMLSANLTKLKKQGIIIKKNNSNNSAMLQGVKIGQKQIPGVVKGPQSISKPIEENTSTNNSGKILTKLLNQSNSQLKIVKKSLYDTKESIESDEKNKTNDQPLEDVMPDIETENKNKSTAKISDNPLNAQADDSKKSDCGNFYDFLEETENKNNKSDEDDEKTQDTQIEKEQTENIQGDTTSKTEDKSNHNKLNIFQNISPHITVKSLSSNRTLNDEILTEIADNTTNKNDSPDEDFTHTEVENEQIKTHEPDDVLLKTEDISDRNKLNILKNISSNVTIKSLSTNKPIKSEISSENMRLKECSKIDAQHNKQGQTGVNIENHKKVANNMVVIDKKPLNTLNQIGNSVSVKSPLNKSIPTDKLKSADKQFTDEEGWAINTREINNVTKNSETNLDALKNISKNITVKSLSQSNVNKLIKKEIDTNKIKDTEAHLSSTPTEKHGQRNNISKLDTPKETGSLDCSSKEMQLATKIHNTTKHQPSSNILKQLPNITAKPVNPKINSPQSSKQVIIKPKQVIQKNIIMKRKEEVEIFNVDDSDDELENSQSSIKSSYNDNTTSIKESNSEKPNAMKVLRNLGKDITFKSTSHQVDTENNFDSYSDGETELNTVQKVKKCGINNAIQKKLKILKGVTVKSRISPILGNTDADASNHQNDENVSDRLKISEVSDDFTSDDDMPLKMPNKNITAAPIVEEPDNTDSEHEPFNEESEDIHNITKPVTNETPACLSNLKNVTIVSSKEVKKKQEVDKPVAPVKNKETYKNNESNSLINTQITRSTGRTYVQPSQMNTVNKEVHTVRTYKTQTVVEEVTTTVTKTIRTINQAVRHSNASSTLKSQKIQGIRPNQSMNNILGANVRPAGSTIGPRIRNANTVIRPMGGNIRPSNQLVPIRGTVISRPNCPNSTSLKRPALNSNKQGPIGRPLKISPNAIVTPTSSAVEDEKRPFSCFKKPKESLIPGLDEISNQEDSFQQFSSSTQKAKSKIIHTSNTAKRNSTVTSTQVKSEFRASMQQCKVANLAGCKVMKTSQTQQTSKIECNTANATKRSTLEAIEKLQKQGLLIKKPRLSENRLSDRLNSDDDDSDT